MVDIEVIEREILDLEKRDTTYATIERLAWLYIVRDHLVADKAKESLGAFTGTEFCEACSGVPMNSLMEILSEHFEIIEATYPKEYDAILSRIRSI